jgi:hypothetical protein
MWIKEKTSWEEILQKKRGGKENREYVGKLVIIWSILELGGEIDK